MADLHVLKLLVEKSELWVTKKKSGNKVRWWCGVVVEWCGVVVSVW